MEKDCLFCKIASGQTPTEILFEDDQLVVFKDIHPAAPIHLLIVPKKHIRSINDISAEDLPIIGQMHWVARQMAREHGVSGSGYRLFTNVEKGGGQLIFHLHMHLIGGWK